MTGATWTPREDAILRERYPDEPAAVVAAAIGRSLHAVYYRASQLGLAKSGSFLASPASGRADLAGRGRSTQFTKGGPAWNKGIKGATGHHPNSRRTQFKKGCMTGAAQHNYQPIGTLRINKGVLEQKVTDDPALYPARRWRPVARIVWEQAHEGQGMKNKIEDVRNHLVAMLEMLGDDTRSADEMAQAIERAKATASIAGTYIAAVRVEIDAIRVLDETGRLPTAVAGVQQVVALDGRPAGPVPMRMIAGSGR